MSHALRSRVRLWIVALACLTTACTGVASTSTTLPTSSTTATTSVTTVSSPADDWVDLRYDWLGLSLRHPPHWRAAAETLSLPNEGGALRELVVLGTGELGTLDADCPAAPARAVAALGSEDVLFWLVEYEPMFSELEAPPTTLPGVSLGGQLSPCAATTTPTTAEFLRWTQQGRGLFLVVLYGGQTTAASRRDALAVVNSIDLYAPEQDCVPSPTEVAPKLGGPEVRAASDADLDVWALFFTDSIASGGEPVVVPVHRETKIVWRITGGGSLEFRAVGPGGRSISPVWGPEGHIGSNWDRPGSEWGTGWIFPEPGCWTIHVRRGGSSAQLGIEVTD